MAHKIQTDKLIKLLENNALGEIDPPLTQNRIICARFLIDKELGNKKPVDDTGSSDEKLVISWGK